MSRKVLIGGAIVIMLSTSIYAGEQQQFKKNNIITESSKHVSFQNSNKSNVVTRKLKNGIPVDTVYSEAKVEYADVKTIERLKRAVVILIDKVESFEKRLNKKQISKQNLSTLRKNLKNNFNKKLKNLSKDIVQNTKAIRLLAKRNRKVTRNSTRKSSKYDKKIEEFLNKQKDM